jgi:hypothetical protein
MQKPTNGNGESATRSNHEAARNTFRLSTLAREESWLRRIRQGQGTAAIARREGLDQRTIQRGVAAAKVREHSSRKRDSHEWDEDAGKLVPRIGIARSSGRFEGTAIASRIPEPKLVPLFPIGPLTPRSTCPHRGPIRRGSVLCCMVCSRSGMDDHPALRRDPRTDPRPDPEPRAVPATKPAAGNETRKERRQRLYAACRPGASTSAATTAKAIDKIAASSPRCSTQDR